MKKYQYVDSKFHFSFNHIFINLEKNQFFQVRRCAEGYERGFQLGEGEGKPWRFLLKESEKAFHSDNMIKDVNCPGERSRTQAELAALREARRDQVEEVDQLYSTRQVPFLPSLHRDAYLAVNFDSGLLDT